MKRKLKKIFLNFMTIILPCRVLRRFIIRQVADPDIAFKDNGFTFKLAETKDELEQSFSILYDEYLKKGYQDQHPNQMRVTKFHALPSSAILIVKLGSEVVGTLIVIPDNPLGLPMDQIWDISNLKSRFKKVAELSSLCVKERFQKRKGHILFPMFAYLFNYSRYYLGVDCLVIATNKNVRHYYQCIFNFEPVKNPFQKYPFVKGDAGYGQFISLTHEDTKSQIASAPRCQNNKAGPLLSQMADFESIKNLNYMCFPKKSKSHQTHLMTPDILNYFFNERVEVFNQISQDDKDLIKSIYHHDFYSEIIQPGRMLPPHLKRQCARYSVYWQCVATTSKPKDRVIPLVDSHIYDISETGLRFCSPNSKLNPGDVVLIKTEKEEGKAVKIKAKVIWKRNFHYGLQLINQPPLWLGWVKEIESHWGIKNPTRKSVTSSAPA